MTSPEKYHVIEIERRSNPRTEGPRQLWVTATGWENELPIGRYREIVEAAVAALSASPPQTCITEIMDPVEGVGQRIQMRDEHRDMNDARLIAHVAKQIAKVTHKERHVTK